MHEIYTTGLRRRGGIQLAPALAQAAAGLIRSDALPDRLVAMGLDPASAHRARPDGLTWSPDH